MKPKCDLTRDQLVAILENQINLENTRVAINNGLMTRLFSLTDLPQAAQDVLNEWSACHNDLNAAADAFNLLIRQGRSVGEASAIATFQHTPQDGISLTKN